MRMTSSTLVLLACVAIAGCRETASCAENQVYDRMNGCVPRGPSDSGVDATVDAGDFCDTCEAPSICDRDNLECDDCMTGASPTGCPTDAPFCDPTGHCVQCTEDTDCSDPAASHCADSSCSPCSASSDCAHVVDGTTALATCDDARTPPTCVECTEADESSQCDRDLMTFGCVGLTGRCADTPRTQDLCDTCTHDYDCLRGQRCLELTVGGSPIGTFCMLEQTASQPCGDTVASVRPYSHPRVATSVDGADGTFCFPPDAVSCQTLRDYNNTTCTVDTDCGLAGVADGDCPPSGGRCSYNCGSDLDCREDANCSLGTPPRYCRPD